MIPSSPPKSTSTARLAELDIQTLLGTFEVLSNELSLNRLLKKLITILISNTYAHRGIVLLEKNGILHVMVEGICTSASGQSSKVNWPITSKVLDIPGKKYRIPQSIISHIVHTHEPVRLENAYENGCFSHDDYIRTYKVKSVVATPLLYSDCLRGIMYLENNAMESAFPPGCMQILKILSGQAIMSIENAMLHEIEIKQLQSRVSPHFLFNALNTIAELCHNNATGTEDAIVNISTLYRYSLSSEKRLVTVDEELTMVKKYLAIEKLRFGNRISCTIHTTGETSQSLMPSMIVQPLVENSIRHGITPRPSGGTIIITICVTEQTCSITVSDNGIGTHTIPSDKGYGLRSIRKRLFQHYGTKATITISTTTGYTVYITFPATRKNSS